MKTTLLFCTLLLLGMAACGPSLSPFTERLYDANNWSVGDLKKIQFYLSNDIVLRRELAGGSSVIEGGEIKMENGRKIEQVTIPGGTPGVLIAQPKDNRFAVSFESGSNARYLLFGPNPKRDGTYVLLAKDWDKNSGKVLYDNQTFYVTKESAMAALLVDLKKTNHVSVNSRRAEGRTVE
jgi:hypothetical protein